MQNEKIDDYSFHHLDGAGLIPMAGRSDLFKKVRADGKTQINEAWNSYKIHK